MVRTRTPRDAASTKKPSESIIEANQQKKADLRSSLDAGIEIAQQKLSGIDASDIKEKKEAAALLEKLLKLRREFTSEKERPTEIQLIWNTSEDPSDVE